MAMDLARRLGADKVFLFDPRGGLLARTDRMPRVEAGHDFSPLSWVKIPLTRRTETSAVIFDVQGSPSLYLVASAPITQGLGSEQKLNGVVAGAFELGEAWVGQLGSLMSADIALVGNAAPRGEAPSATLLAATPGLRDSNLPSRLPDAAAFSDALLRRGLAFGPVELTLHGRAFIGAALPIRSGEGEPIAAVIVARPKDVEMAAFRQTRRSLLVVGLILALVSLPASLLWAMSLSRPIRRLAGAAEDIGRGELDVDLPRAGGEVGVLARAFGSMVAELKAKAALEAAVAVGKMRVDETPTIVLGLGPGGRGPRLERRLCRPLRAALRAGRGRDGDGLPSPRPRAGRRGGAQGPEADIGRGRRRHTRARPRRRDAAPGDQARAHGHTRQRGAGPRLRRERRHPVLHHGVRAGHHPA